MRKVFLLLVVPLLFGAEPAAAQMKFFVTSAPGPDATGPRGIRDADDYCSSLGYAAGLGDFTWKAYLDVPAAEGQPAQKAHERIGEGPWHNYEGYLIAASVEDLVSGKHNLNRETAFNERGYLAYAREDSPSPAAVLESAAPDEKGLYLCFAQ